ncbi:nuclear transport factor 2 family protein [Actinoplanes sp. NPDC051861]|uniref:nuclear transport factor 2 family protein n=1 Tax=Actinoplanes sp. NPDC051861 TaxID=3155170 RepID=UPI003445A4E3
MSETAAREHIARFNTAVTSGNWSAFTAPLHDEAVMTFIGPPVGPFRGRDAITRAYESDPPGDTMRVVGVESASDTDLVTFEWSRGGTGTLTLGYRDGRIAALTVRFL